MAEDLSADLTYGRLGEVTYDTIRQEWHLQKPLQRHAGIRIINRMLSTFETSLGPSEPHQQEYAQSRQKHIRSLLQSCPEIVPAGSLVSELSYVSEAVNAVTTWHDPITSDLLAFGIAKISEKEVSKGHGARVIALVGGQCREKVQLARLTSQRVRLEGLGSRFGTSKVDDEDCCWWASPHGPVQQVCFSERDGWPSKWLAVRTRQHVTILRLTLKRSIAQNQCSEERNDQVPTRLSVENIVTIRSDGLHVYVTFNPWDEMQVAVIDAKGCLAIWHVERSESKSGRWTARSGPKTDSLDGEHSQDMKETDGWGKVLWVSDSRTMVAATRKTFIVHAIDSPENHLNRPILLPEKDSGWILDMKRSKADPSHVFLLTSHRIFFIRILSATEREIGGEENIGAEILLSCLHHRAPRDISLCMSIGAHSDGTLIILYSIITGHATSHEFSMPAHFNPYHSPSDPFIIRDPPTKNRSRKDAVASSSPELPRPLFIALEAIECMSGEDEPSKSKASETKAYQLYQLRNDSKLVMTLCILSRDLNVTTHGKLFFTKNQKSRAKQPQKDNTSLDFIVPDDVTEEKNRKDQFNLRLNSMLKRDSSNKETPTMNLDWLVKVIQQVNAATYDESRALRSLDDVGTRLLENQREKPAGIYTLAELLPQRLPPVEDVDEASAVLQSLLDQIHDLPGEHDDDLRTAPVVTPTIARLLQGANSGQSNTVPLLPIYDTILNGWISPLAAEVSGRQRIQLHRQIKQVAAQLVLASNGVILESAENDTEDAVAGKAEFVLPMRRKRSTSKLRSSSGSSTGMAQAREAIAGPSREYTTLPSTPQGPPAPSPRYTPFANLQKYTALTARGQLSKPLTRVVDQWEIGTHPQTVDWLAAFGDTSRQEMETVSKKHKAKLAKREKLQSSQLQAPAAPPQIMLSSQISVGADRRSSPVAPRGLSLPQREKKSGFLASSQVSAGAKRQRKQGF